MGRCLGSLQEGPRSYPQGPHQARRQKEQRCWTQELRHQAPLCQGTPRCRREEDLRSPQEAQGLIKIVLLKHMKNTKQNKTLLFLSSSNKKIMCSFFHFLFFSSIFIYQYSFSPNKKPTYSKVLIIFLVV